MTAYTPDCSMFFGLTCQACGISHPLKIVRQIDLRRPGYAVAQSQDGTYTVVGTETGATVFDEAGGPQTVFPNTQSTPLLVHRAFVTPDCTSFIVGTRAGDVVCLDFVEGAPHRSITQERCVYHCDGDLHTFAPSRNGAGIAVGHLKGGVTMLDAGGDEIWHYRCETSALAGAAWSVACAANGAYVYAGSAGGDGGLSLLDAGTGALICKRTCGVPITSLRTLPHDLGVIAATPIDAYTDRIMVYTPDLQTVRWEKRLSGPLTALAVDGDAPVIALGVGYEGGVTLLDARRGTTLAHRTLYEMANDISIVGGGLVSVVTQHSHVITLRYTQPD